MEKELIILNDLSYARIIIFVERHVFFLTQFVSFDPSLKVKIKYYVVMIKILPTYFKTRVLCDVAAHEMRHVLRTLFPPNRNWSNTFWVYTTNHKLWFNSIIKKNNIIHWGRDPFRDKRIKGVHIIDDCAFQLFHFGL